jgi:hypothetical protein
VNPEQAAKVRDVDADSALTGGSPSRSGVGGTRRLRISPQLGYGEKGIPGVIPPNSVLNAEVTILEENNSSG